MKDLASRKPVYIQRYLWNLLEEDASKKLEPVTNTLREVLIKHYGEIRVENALNNKFPSFETTSTTVANREDEF